MDSIRASHLLALPKPYIVAFIRENGADAVGDWTDGRTGKSLLELAVDMDARDAVDALLEEGNISRLTRGVGGGLAHSAQSGYVLRALVRHGCSLWSRKGRSRRTVLMSAAHAQDPTVLEEALRLSVCIPRFVLAEAESGACIMEFVPSDHCMRVRIVMEYIRAEEWQRRRGSDLLRLGLAAADEVRKRARAAGKTWQL